MTRFARSLGSKASNKREPEASTPWSQMVSTLKAQQGAGVEDVEDDVDFDIKDEEEGEDSRGGGGGAGEEEGDEDSNEEEAETKQSLADRLTVKQKEVDDDDEDEADEEDAAGGDGGGGGGVKRKIELVSSEQSEGKKKKKRKKSEKCKVCGEKGHRKMDCEQLPEERRKELKDLFTMKVERKGCGTGRKKNKKNKDKLPYEESKENTSGEKTESSTKVKGKYVKNARQPAEVRDRSGAVVEEGEALFQGFRVTKDDQKRLQRMYRELKGKGLTKGELDATLKKERRIAEKRLARAKKLVCFQCRQPGHQLADCPANKGQEQASSRPPASGLCFKCGSLEHTSKDCKSKLKRENAYKFAICFICKEEGHLAKACPDNPRGMYPRGGGCVFCGSVEHLKRDCPRKAAKDLKAGVVARTLDTAGDIEDEPAINVPGVEKRKKKKPGGGPSKVVAF